MTGNYNTDDYEYPEDFDNDVEQYDDSDYSDELEPSQRSRLRSASNDITFGYIFGLALSIGLIPLVPQNADMRYTLSWGGLAFVGVLAWLLGNTDRIDQEQPANIIWGAGFGILISAPFLLFGSSILSRVSHEIFPNLQAGTVLAYLVFVMPLAETLFFRGLMQYRLPFWMAGLFASIWSIVLFFPVMWNQLIDLPAVIIIVALTLSVMSMIYSYVRHRNGLAAAWVCQIVSNLLLLFIPFMLFDL